MQRRKTKETHATQEEQRITPLHRDPKQQELRIHLRIRFGLGPYKDPFRSRTLNMFKRHWFYRLGQQTCQKVLVL
jgi:hypothetical protein